MKFRFLATVVVLALTSVAAHAQAGIYLNPIAIRVSNSVADTGPFAFLGQGSTSQFFEGVNFGGYYNFFHQGQFEAGLDLRDAITRGNNASLNSFLAGARVAVSPFRLPFKPYAQVSVGTGRTSSPTSQLHTSKVEYGVFAGVDYTLNRHFDFRAIEVGYSSLQTISSSIVGGSTLAIPSSSLLSISTGIVIRIP